MASPGRGATGSERSPSGSPRRASPPWSSTTAASGTAPGSTTSSTRNGNSEDWRAAIAFARGLPGIDPERIATFGSSLAAGTRWRRPPRDRRIAAAISQVPFLDRATQAYRAAPPVQAEIQAAAAAGGHLPAVGQPHEAAFINAPGAEAGWRHVVAIGEDSRWRNRASAGWLLNGYSPIVHAATLHCPWLVCVAGDDNVALPGPAIAAARRAPQGEVRTYPGVGHFDIYDGPEHEAVIADELEFLTRIRTM